MPPNQQTLFALDCGATNWRLYRSNYLFEDGKARLMGEPQVSPLTSFTDRKLPAAILLNETNTGIDAIGEVARGLLDDERLRARVRDYFKPCIGAHLEENPLPHQLHFSHEEALDYSKMLLNGLVEQIRMEKWRASDFDERVLFSFAYPVHWRLDHEGAVFEDFARMVFSCFEPAMASRIRFVAEPEGAILALQRGGFVQTTGHDSATLIIDAGGSTTDIIAGKVHPATGDLHYLGRYGEPFGGCSYDAEIAYYIGDELGIYQNQMDEEFALMTSLRSFAQRLKESLSRQMLQAGSFANPPQRMISLVTEAGHVYRKLIQLDTGLFNEITGHLQTGFEALIEKALDTIGIPDSEIGQVMLVGGGAQLFTIVDHLRHRFGADRILLADNPAEIVVQGIGLEYGKSFEDYEPTIIFTTLTPRPSSLPGALKALRPAYRLVSDEFAFDLYQPNIYSIGRDKSSDIQLNYEKVSRHHAEIRVEGALPFLVDLGSTNGTYINDTRIPPHEPIPIEKGMEIRFGDTRLNLTD